MEKKQTMFYFQLSFFYIILHHQFFLSHQTTCLNQNISQFFKFVKSHYKSWLKDGDEPPILSHTLMKEKVFPNLSNDKPSFFLLIDNLRYDQWKIIENKIFFIPYLDHTTGNQSFLR